MRFRKAAIANTVDCILKVFAAEEAAERRARIDQKIPSLAMQNCNRPAHEKGSE
jgi:hypothetical protein